MTPALAVIFVFACVVCFLGGRVFERYEQLTRTKEQTLFGKPKPLKMPSEDTKPKPATTSVRATSTTGATSGSPIGCPVENCRIKTPHSHTQALVERLKGK